MNRWCQAATGALLLSLAACAQTSPGAVGGTPSPSSPPPLCGGDSAAGRTVAVYRALLLDKGSPVKDSFGSPTRLYVSQTWIDGVWFGPDVPTGQLDPAVLRCLTAGVPGLPPVTTVPRPGDASIPTVATNTIPGFVGGAVEVTFGAVRGSGSTVTSVVSVDAGRGQFSGGKATVRLRGEVVVSVETHQKWVS